MGYGLAVLGFGTHAWIMGCYSKQGSRLGCSLSGGMRVGYLGVDLGLAQY